MTPPRSSAPARSSSEARGASGARAGRVDSDDDINDVVEQLKVNGLEVEVDHKRHRNTVPNDSGWASIRTAMEDIKAPQAWDIHTGASSSSSPIVCVIDGGINYNHPDLKANMHPLIGYDALSNKQGSGVMDQDGHGSHCSGTIAGVGNNAAGITGVSWGAKLVGCRFMDKNGEGYDSDAIECICWCRQQGAKITSNSWGGSDTNQALLDEMLLSEAAGGLFIVASGNEGTDTSLTPSYPGSYAVPSVIHVSAVDPQNDKVPSWSN
ncbi:hypothetical protein FOA52_002269 [Chlamydomonas sp. UWO 241]|nr:hypothetical protein FOA52_002269 [Chlamydomonas sp. UWO 241]